MVRRTWFSLSFWQGAAISLMVAGLLAELGHLELVRAVAAQEVEERAEERHGEAARAAAQPLSVRSYGQRHLILRVGEQPLEQPLGQRFRITLRRLERYGP